ncbi:MAG: F0F1 ATP synthase subunit epsilon [Oscillospiraceae bacterium]|nr:F0F1 ATP synthase subunit epsilon [Oscillospiraceae bacterium]
MNTFALRITSPEGDLFSGEATMLSVRGTEGELAVMAGHVPFVSYIVPSDCKVELPDGTVRQGRIERGVLTVSTDKVILLSGDFSWK